MFVSVDLDIHGDVFLTTEYLLFHAWLSVFDFSAGPRPKAGNFSLLSDLQLQNCVGLAGRQLLYQLY